MYHHPIIAAQITVACVCLHNIAMTNGMPAPIEEHEEDPDGQRILNDHVARPPVPRPHYPAPPQIGEVNRRGQFIEEHFNYH